MKLKIYKYIFFKKQNEKSVLIAQIMKDFSTHLQFVNNFFKQYITNVKDDD